MRLQRLKKDVIRILIWMIQNKRKGYLAWLLNKGNPIAMNLYP